MVASPINDLTLVHLSESKKVGTVVQKVLLGYFYHNIHM